MVEVKSGLQASRSIPAAPLLLGLSGLLPFWGLALALLVPRLVPWQPAASDLALATYAAVIVSFLGGIRWGLAVAAPDQSRAAMHYAISVVPSLAAWALLILPEPWRLLGLGILAIVLGLVDVGLVPAGFAPTWFGRLRLILSGGAGVALLLAAVALRSS